MGFYHSGEDRIFYETVGDKGPWLALINGYARSSSDFRILARKLAEHSFRILLMDNRGSGQSTAIAPYSIDTLADDLAHIADSLAITELAVLGISLGGVITQSFAARHAQRLSHLILVSTGNKPEYFAPTKVWPRDLSEALDILRPLVAEEFRRKNPLLFEALCKNIVQQSQNEEFQRQATQQRAALLSYLARPHHLGQISCPTLILHGVEDAIVPCQAARDLQQVIPHAHLRLLPQAGHLLLVEKPTDLVDAILLFMGQEKKT